jgi:hypothetical protein
MRRSIITSRQAKRAGAVAAFVLFVVVMSSWGDDDDEDGNLKIFRVFTNGSNQVVFSLTNSYTSRRVLIPMLVERTKGKWNYDFSQPNPRTILLPGCGVTNLTHKPNSTNEWRMRINHAPLQGVSAVSLTWRRLVYYARHQVLLTADEVRDADDNSKVEWSPIMPGNAPAPPQKP